MPKISMPCPSPVPPHEAPSCSLSRGMRGSFWWDLRPCSLFYQALSSSIKLHQAPSSSIKLHQAPSSAPKSHGDPNEVRDSRGPFRLFLIKVEKMENPEGSLNDRLTPSKRVSHPSIRREKTEYSRSTVSKVAEVARHVPAAATAFRSALPSLAS